MTELELFVVSGLALSISLCSLFSQTLLSTVRALNCLECCTSTDSLCRSSSLS